jgi:hypothetical protein
MYSILLPFQTTVPIILMAFFVSRRTRRQSRWRRPIIPVAALQRDPVDALEMIEEFTAT